jgi:hypothetical protein
MNRCYRTRMRKRATAVAALAAAALIVAASGSATTAPPPVVLVKVTITDSKFAVTPNRAVRGAYARFVLVNRGSKTHGFALGAAKKGAGKQTGFTQVLKPSQQKILFLFLDYRGKVSYRATLPADHAKPGMRGVFTIS